MEIGLYNRWLTTLGGGERHSLAIAEYLSRSHHVTVLSSADVDAGQISERLGLDVARICFQPIVSRDEQTLAAATRGYDLFINASNWDFFPSQARHSVMLVYFPLKPVGQSGRLRYLLGRVLTDSGIAAQIQPLTSRLLPGMNTRLENLIPPNFLDCVATYDSIWANSRFTQKWIQEYWQLESDVLTPPVAVDAFHSAAKQLYILSVGRFFAGNHNKKHLAMVQTFGEMVDDGLTGWELHLVGGIAQGAEHLAYLDRVRAAAEGYPITIHVDLPFDGLHDLYAAGAIYWHAAGYGEDEATTPEKFEHFGITTVEAMAAGCVPVVFGKGGQPEVVAHGTDGFLWYTGDELKRYTLDLIGDPEARQEMSLRAMAASRQFDQTRFEERLAALLQGLHL